MCACDQAVGRDAVKVAREVTSGRGASAWDLSALQRIAAAASEPLIALGRSAGAVLVSGLGSTTAAALTSGLGILRLGVGVQLLLFHHLCWSRPPCSRSKSGSHHLQVKSLGLEWDIHGSRVKSSRA